MIQTKLTNRLAYMGKAAVNSLNFVQPDQAVPLQAGAQQSGQAELYPANHWLDMAGPHPTDGNITVGKPQTRSFHFVNNKLMTPIRMDMRSLAPLLPMVESADSSATLVVFGGSGQCQLLCWACLLF